MSHILTAQNVNKKYGKFQALKDVNININKGKIVGLIGPNGAGKSTILHSIFGFTNIFSGKILIGDGDDKKDITSLTSSEKLKNSGIAYILQDKSVFPGMTVEENLWMGGYLMDKPEKAKEAAEKIFSLVMLGMIRYMVQEIMISFMEVTTMTRYLVVKEAIFSMGAREVICL